MTKPVIVYGASGYTGKLICWHLADAKIPFVAAGRSKARLKEQMMQVPELASADYEIVEVTHDKDALVTLFKGAKVVYNVIGPFMQLGDPVVQAALEAGCHYIDTTGETDWVAHVRDNYGDAFEAKKLLLAPATSYMWTAGNVAAEVALETPEIDSLDILYLGDSNTSVASTKSFLRMCTKPQYYLEHNELVMWPFATAFDVVSPDMHRVLKALPWSGGAEPIWYQNDERVKNCSVLVSFKNQTLFTGILGVLQDFESKYRGLPVEEHENITNLIGGQITTEEPNREDPDKNRSVISCIGRGNTSGKRVILRGNSAYIQTGSLAAIACKAILDAKLLAIGFQSICKAVGHRNIIDAWAKEGLHCSVEENS